MIAEAVGLKNPYPGLRSFEAEDAEYFFGRDHQVDELLPRLRDHRFVAVVGLSGSGKSSLVRAGLIPALKAGHLTTSGSRWRIAVMRPGSHPIVALAAALDQALVAAPDRVANLRKNTNSLLHESRTGRSGDESLLVVVDQFEELFRVSDAREAAHFVDLLLAVEQDVSPDFRTYVVLTMRTDRLGECSRFDGLPEVLNRSQYLVPKLGSDQLRQAIEGPAALTDTEIEPGLVQQLVVEASEGSDRLPLLQHMLMILWEGRKPSPDGSQLISLDQYREASSAADALNDHADRTLKELPEDRQRVASLVFRALTGGGAGSDLRRPLRLSQLADETGASPDEVREVVEHFRAANFLTSPDRGLTLDWEADITHESLIRQWKKLSDWVAEEATDAEDYRFYSLNAVRNPGPLTERSLESAVRWLAKGHTAAWAARYGGDFEAAVRYIRRSEQAHIRELAEAEFERVWRRYWLPAGVILGIVFALFQFQRINRLVLPLFQLVEPYLRNKAAEQAYGVKEGDLTPAATMFVIATLIVCFALVFERYGRPVLHRLTIQAITKRVLDTLADTRIQLPPVPTVYAGFGRRAVVVFVDVFLFALGLRIAGMALGLTIGYLAALGITYLLWSLCYCLYQVLIITSKRQATLGMTLAGVYVSDVYGDRLSRKRAAVRHAAKLLTACSVIGPLMPLWTKRRQALHDLVAGSVVRIVEAVDRGIELPDVPEMYAEFGRRALSTIFDGSLFYLGLGATFWALRSTGVDFGTSLSWAYYFWFPCHFLYQVLTIASKRQATLGMMLARVYVTDAYGKRLSWKRASMRHVAKVLTIYSVIGAFMPLWTKRCQTLHDLIVGSVVRHRDLPRAMNPKSSPAETRMEPPVLSAAVDRKAPKST